MIPIRNSKQRCSIEHYDDALFFSLVCYRNNLFTSNDPEKIIEFYNGFENSDELILWMKERPKGASYIHEVDGDKDIIVVIPTADFNGKYAINCRENIFKGLHMVFVESGENPDPYFNYAHNCNVGIKKAMEYNPKWIVLSNDDMYKVDDISVLVNALTELENGKISLVFTTADTYHSVPGRFSQPNKLFYLFTKFRDRNQKLKMMLWNKYNILFFLNPRGIKWNLFFKKGVKCYSIASFGIFSARLVKNTFPNGIFDENFITATEDIDLSLKLTVARNDFSFIEYKIGNYINGTVGSSFAKELRDVAGDALLHYLIFKGVDQFHIKIRESISGKHNDAR